jgi:hypothetical protein
MKTAFLALLLVCIIPTCHGQVRQPSTQEQADGDPNLSNIWLLGLDNGLFVFRYRRHSYKAKCDAVYALHRNAPTEHVTGPDGNCKNLLFWLFKPITHDEFSSIIVAEDQLNLQLKPGDDGQALHFLLTAVTIE